MTQKRLDLHVSRIEELESWRTGVTGRLDRHQRIAALLAGAVLLLLAAFALTACGPAPAAPSTYEPPPPPTTAVGPPRIEVAFGGLGPIFSSLYTEGNIAVSVWGDITAILERPIPAGDSLDGGQLLVVDHGCYGGSDCPPDTHERQYGGGLPRDGSISTRIVLLNVEVDLELRVETAGGTTIRVLPRKEHVLPRGNYAVNDGRITRIWPRELEPKPARP